MTSGGISSFANSVDDVVNTTASNEKEKSSSRKYFDEEEKSEDLIEDEEMMGDADSEEENSDEEKASDENSDSQDGESEEPESEEEFGPWREGDSRNEGEHDEEPESEKESDGETKEGELENETIDKSDESKDDGQADESKQIEDGETEVESSSSFDEEKDNTSTASNAENNEEEVITVERNASPSEVEEITVERNTSPSEIEEITVERTASPSEIDELVTVEKKATPSEATPSEATPSEATPSEIEEIITVATDSEIFVVATESIILEATSSNVKQMGGIWCILEQDVPAIVVWGDVGYNPDHVNNGNLGMYIGGLDDIGHGQEHGGVEGQNKGKVALHYTSKKSLKEIMDSDFKHRNEKMPAPQFIKETGWYVQTRGRFADDAIGSMNSAAVRANGYNRKNAFSTKTKRDDNKWTIDELKKVWPDFLKVPFKSYGTYTNGDNLEKRIREEGGNFSILNDKQNIRGYKVTKVNKDGTYNVEVIDHIKFNNDWAMYEKEATSSWHIEGLDDEITTKSTGDDWTARFNTAYYGIHVTEAKGNAKTKVHLDAYGNGNAWKSGAKVTDLYGTMDENASYTITVPKGDKNVKWTDKDGKEYKLQGWVLFDQNADENKDNIYNNRLKGVMGESPVSKRENVEIRRPGETFTLKPAKDWGNRRWPVTLGPFYRDTYNGVEIREGVRYGLADLGLQLRNNNDPGGFQKDEKRTDKNGVPSATYKWFMFTKAERMRDEWKSGKGDNRSYIDKIQYNVIFYAPVLEEVKNREATLDLNGGSWATSGRSNTIKFSNFETTSLPGASDVKRTGYTFDGWYTKKDGGNKITSLGS